MPDLTTPADVRQSISFDAVTSLPNRQQFLLDALSGFGPATDAIMVTLADARHFNGILRALGHEYSEDFIRHGVARIRSVLPTEIQIYHVSVLSFAFTCTAAQSLAVSLVKCFTTPLVVDGIPILTQVGIGLVALAGQDPAMLLRAALSAAQDSRRSPVRWSRYNSVTDGAHRRGFQLLGDMSQALLAQDQLHLLYQPKIDLRSGHCCGVEALLRWTHPTLGPVSPAEFVPLVENTALIGPLTEWVVNAGIMQLARWIDENIPLKMAINASPHNLSKDGFPDFVSEIVVARGVPPGEIELEFTEGALAADDAKVVAALQTLRATGMSIALDDFGTGFSNLSYLTDLPANILKIDGSFIRKIGIDPRAELLVESIIELGHRLDFRIVAEGIETVETFATLRGWGCDEGQGYYFNRPMEPALLQEWFEARR